MELVELAETSAQSVTANIQSSAQSVRADIFLKLAISLVLILAPVLTDSM